MKCQDLCLKNTYSKPVIREGTKKSLWRSTSKNWPAWCHFTEEWSDVWCERDSLIWYLTGWCVTPGNHWTAALLCHTYFNHLVIKKTLKSVTWINVLSLHSITSSFLMQPLPVMPKSVQLKVWTSLILLQTTGHPLRLERGKGCTMQRIQGRMKGHFVSSEFLWGSHHPRSGVTPSLDTSAAFGCRNRRVSTSDEGLWKVWHARRDSVRGESEEERDVWFVTSGVSVTFAFMCV